MNEEERSLSSSSSSDSSEEIHRPSDDEAFSSDEQEEKQVKNKSIKRGRMLSNGNTKADATTMMPFRKQIKTKSRDTDDEAYRVKIAKSEPAFRSTRIKKQNTNYDEDEVDYGLDDEDDAQVPEKQEPLIESILGMKKLESGSMQYLVKWRNKSYLHCEWVSQALIEEDTLGPQRFKRFLNSPEAQLSSEDTEYFDPSYVEIERILDSTKGKRETRKDRWTRECTQIMSKLKNLRRNGVKIATFFLQPVDEELDGAVDYYKIIEHPMDFGKIWSNLVDGEVYKTHEDFAKDVRLVFSNCRTYNSEGESFVRECGETLSQLFEEKYQAMVNYLEEQANAPVQDDQVAQYLVKWRGLSYADATWEDEADIVDDRMIGAYFRRNELPKIKKKVDNDTQPTFLSYSESPVFKDGLTLRSYQVQGLNWLAFNHANHRGCILADEMGLGKTCQTVAFVQHLNLHGNIGNKPCLIVAPLSTLGHWKNEFERWTELNCLMYHDSGSRLMTGAETRAFIREEEFFYWDAKRQLVPGLFKFKVLVTSYETLVSDAAFLQGIPFAALIVDEGQRLKSQSSKLALTFRDFISADMRVLLSGTPLQNNVAELWSLLNFVQADAFPNQDRFMEEFGDMQNADQVKNLQNRIKPFMLRRLKEDVEKDIPPKEETVIDVELTMLQKKYYRAIFERNREFLRAGGTSKSNVPQLTNIEMELRKCCNHPFLIKGVQETTVGKGIPASLDQLIQGSGKMILLDKLFAKLRGENRKVLVFSQFKIMLDIVSEYCGLKHYPHERIDGNVSGVERQKAIDRFCSTNQSFVFLLSTRAGGVGINLTAADTVIIFDSDWNPQNDLQAMARCHRIGQKKNVMVYRFVTKNTYESKLFESAARKLGLERAVLGHKGGAGEDSELSKDEVEELLRHGAYRLLEDDEESERRSKQYCEADIEDLLKRDSRKLDWNKQQPEDGEKANAFNFSKATFVAAGTDQEIDVTDPSFWTKVLGADPRSTLVARLVDGSAYATPEARQKFFDELLEYGNQMVSAKLGGNPNPPYEDQIMDCLLQIKNMPRTFSKMERDAADDFRKQIERPSRRLEKVIQFYENQHVNQRVQEKRAPEKADDQMSDDDDSGDSSVSGMDKTKTKGKRRGPKPKVIPETVKIDGRDVEVKLLQEAIKDYGGLEEVQNENKWSDVRLACAIPKSAKAESDLIEACELYCKTPKKRKPRARKTRIARAKRPKREATRRSRRVHADDGDDEDDNAGSEYDGRSDDEVKVQRPKPPRPPKESTLPSQKEFLDNIKIEILDPSVYDELNEKGEPWCRYCGARATSGWSRGPWGSKKLCIPHYVDWWQKKRLDLSQYEDEEPKQPINPAVNTEFKYNAWREYRDKSVQEQSEISTIKSAVYDTTKSPYFRTFKKSRSRLRRDEESNGDGKDEKNDEEQGDDMSQDENEEADENQKTNQRERADSKLDKVVTKDSLAESDNDTSDSSIDA